MLVQELLNVFPNPGVCIKSLSIYTDLALRVPPIPTPPATTKDPELVEVEATATGRDITSPIVSILNAVVFDPSLTENAVVEELLCVYVPVSVTDPLLNTTPEIEEALEVEVKTLPPIPTPPVTTNVPVAVDVEAIEDVKATPPPTNKLLLIPTPPDTTKDPVKGLDDANELNILTSLPKLVVPAIAAPPATIKAPVVVFVDAVLA